MTTTINTYTIGAYQNKTYRYTAPNPYQQPIRRCPCCGQEITKPLGYTESEQPCLVEECAKQIRLEQGLPPGTPVVTMVYCNCPKCSPRC